MPARVSLWASQVPEAEAGAPGGLGGALYQHRVETQVRRPRPGVQSRAPGLAVAWPALSSSCMAETKTCRGEAGWVEESLSASGALGRSSSLRPSPLPSPRGLCRGEGEGLRAEPWRKVPPHLCSQCVPHCPLPVDGSHLL